MSRHTIELDDLELATVRAALQGEVDYQGRVACNLADEGLQTSADMHRLARDIAAGLLDKLP